MAFEVGERVVTESESTDRRPRPGVIEEVLRGDPSPRYRIRWDDGRGYSFYVTEANAPLFNRFAEDYNLEPEGEGTRFTWTVGLEPKPAIRLPFKAIAPVLKAAFGKLASDGQKYFATR